MTKFEKVLLLTCLIGIILRFIQLPGFEPVVVVPFALLAFTYIFFGYFLFKEPYTSFHKPSISIVSGIFLGISLIGILYQLMFFPGEKFFLLIGGFGSMLMFVVIFSYQRRDYKHQDYYSILLTRIAIIGGMAIILYMIPTPRFFAMFYSGDQELIKSFRKKYNNPDNKAFKEAFRKKLHNYKNEQNHKKSK